MKGDKRGLSDLVVVVLLSLIALASVSLVVFFTIGSIRDAGERINFDSFTTSVEIVDESVRIDSDLMNVQLVIKRPAESGKMSGYYVILEDSESKSFPTRFISSIDPLESVPASIDYSSRNMRDIRKIIAVAFLINENGDEVLSNNRDVFDLSQGTSLIQQPECSAGDTRQCETGEEGICSDGTQTCQQDNSWGSCVGEILPGEENEDCNDGDDNDCDGEIDSEDEDCVNENEICFNMEDDNDNGEVDEGCPPILATAGMTLDGFTVDTPQEWNDALDTYEDLRDIGFTHVGVTVYDRNSNVNAKLADLRQRNLNLNIHLANIGDYLINQNDPNNHASNGQNLKYYDSVGFNPLQCTPYCDGVPDSYCNGIQYTGPPALESAYPLGCLCHLKSSNRALDPAYNGILWQQELDLLDSKLDRVTSIQPEDIASYNIEIWGLPGNVDWGDSSYNQCYPGTFMNSQGRYTGTFRQRHQQNYDNWLARSRELTQVFKDRDPDMTVFGFHEGDRGPNWSSGAPWNYVGGWVPYGSSDAPNFEEYFIPNLQQLQNDFSLPGRNYSQIYFWVSFSFYSGTFRYERWDPKITQKAGYMFRQKNVPGIFVYYAPFSIGSPASTMSGVPDFMAHAQAFSRGYIDGIDPGVLTEICGDGIDNDGDVQADEGC